MKRVILVMLLALTLTFAFAFTGCGITDKTESPATEKAQTETGGTAEDPVTGGNGSETGNNANGSVNGRTPVTPVVNGGNINQS